jgi:dihydrofolate synthase / folylpolyglutamate synthase
MTSDTVLERLRRLHPRRIDLALDRLQRLLDALGNPETKLPPVIHVAGTNGKGSVVAFLRAIFEAGGHKTQVYTSPHLVRFHERIRLSTGLISEADLVTVFEEAEAANKGAPITEFEIITAAAFLAFARDPADVCLLEVGLGGRFDATNVIDKPAMTVITPISLDHADWFGPEIAGIAKEKAGIIKPGAPLTLSTQVPEARAVIRNRAAHLAAPIVEQDVDFEARADSKGGFLYRDSKGELALPPPSLAGAYQIGNAAVAIAAARGCAGFEFGAEAFAQGVTRAEWPARMQNITGGALARLLPRGSELWLDGGHNIGAAEALAHTVAAWLAKSPARPVHLVTGMLKTKDPEAFLAQFAAHVAKVHGLAIPGEAASRPAEDIVAAARTADIPAEAALSVEAALREIASETKETPPIVLICGSLYLAGHVLALDETA